MAGKGLGHRTGGWFWPELSYRSHLTEFHVRQNPASFAGVVGSRATTLPQYCPRWVARNRGAAPTSHKPPLPGELVNGGGHKLHTTASATGISRYCRRAVRARICWSGAGFNPKVPECADDATVTKPYDHADQTSTTTRNQMTKSKSRSVEIDR